MFIGKHRGNQRIFRSLQSAALTLAAMIFLIPRLGAQSIPAVSPASQTVLAGFGSLTATISATAGVAWTATSNATWLTFTSGSGTGNGSIQYSFPTNYTGASRTGTITVTSSSGSSMLVVTQAAIASGTPTVSLLNSLTNGNLPSQTQQTLQLSINDPNGPGYIGGVTIMASNSYGSLYVCQMSYYPQSNTFYFVNNTLAGSTNTPYTFGAAGQQANGTHCILDVANSSVTSNPASAAGSLILTLGLTLQPSAVGKQNIYVNAFDMASPPQIVPNFFNSLAGWTAYAEITTAAPTVSMIQTPVSGQSQVLHYKYSDGNGYTYLSVEQGQISASVSNDTPCGFSITGPGSLNLFYIAGGNYNWMGGGAIGGAWSTGINGVIGQAGQCWIDLNNSKIHVSPNPSLPDPDPNSGVYTDLYVDLSISLDPPTSTTLPLNIYLGDADVVSRSVSQVFSGTWPAFPALSVSTGSLPAGSPGQSYSTTVTATGGSGTYSWSAIGLPSPLTMSLTGTISGTPAGTGTYNNVVVTVSDSVSGHTANKTFSLTIGPPLVSVTINSSPSGLQLNVDGTICTSCEFQWAPGSGHTIAVVTSPQTGGAGARYAFLNWTDTGAQTHSITTPSTNAIYTANFKTQYQLTTASSPANGGTLTPVSGGWYDAGTIVTLSETPLSGFSFSNYTNTGGTLSGSTIIVSEPSAVTAVFSNGVFTLSTIPSQQYVVPGDTTAFGVSLTAQSGFSGTVTLNASNMPSGTTATFTPPTVVVSGSSPVTSVMSITTASSTPFGSASLSIIGTSGAHTSAQTPTLTVGMTGSGGGSKEYIRLGSRLVAIETDAGVKITSMSILPSGTAGAPYNGTGLLLTAAGGISPRIWSMVTGSGTLPSGLTLDPTGLLHGTPTTSGSYYFTVKVTDSSVPTAGTDTKLMTLVINNSLQFTTSSPLSTGLIGSSYGVLFTASGGTGPSYSYSLDAVSGTWSGSVPGLTLESGGLFHGNPTTAGQGTLTVSAWDGSTPQLHTSKQFDLTIMAPGPTLQIVTNTLGTGIRAYPYGYYLEATGGTGNLAWTVSGLPNGLSTTPGGYISGTPTSTGTWSNVSVAVADSASPPHTANRTLSITVNSPEANASIVPQPIIHWGEEWTISVTSTTYNAPVSICGKWNQQDLGCSPSNHPTDQFGDWQYSGIIPTNGSLDGSWEEWLEVTNPDNSTTESNHYTFTVQP